MQTHQHQGTARHARSVEYGACLQRPARRPRSRLLSWLLVIAVALAAAAAFARGVTLPNHGAEWAESSTLKAEQRAEQGAERLVRAAQAMCSADHGPQVLAVWIDDSTVECVSPRGRRLSSSQAEVLHASR